ncbi:unannotated protein [freshwater metagenome]|uniref:Unannotated protein n=1 Tax=freshwater metagenome TaxID=449393 RepID=A0A6J7HA13_9ZZZZ
MLEDPCRLLDDASTVLGGGFENRREPVLPDDDVHLTADTRIAEQLLDVEQASGLAVDRVLGPAVAEQRARDRDLCVVDRQLSVGVVDRDGDLGSAERRPSRRAGEDDVLHLSAAEGLCPLLPHDPGERIDDIRLAGSIRADDARDTRLEVQGR